ELFEPMQQAVRVGSSGLVFRRRASPELRELALAAIDSRTGLPIPGARFTLYRAEWPGDLDMYGAPGGLATCSLRPYDDVLIRAAAVGFRARTIAWPDVPESARDGKP